MPARPRRTCATRAIPPATLVVAGSASGLPAGAGVQLFWRDQSAGGAWAELAYAPPPAANGIWYNPITGIDTSHVYEVFAFSDGVESPACYSSGANTLAACPP